MEPIRSFPRERTTSQTLYEKDIETLRRFMDNKGKDLIPTFADAARIAIEYANAHGALK